MILIISLVLTHIISIYLGFKLTAFGINNYLKKLNKYEKEFVLYTLLKYNYLDIKMIEKWRNML